jgi:hypothetical protein
MRKKSQKLLRRKKCQSNKKRKQRKGRQIDNISQITWESLAYLYQQIVRLLSRKLAIQSAKEFAKIWTMDRLETYYQPEDTKIYSWELGLLDSTSSDRYGVFRGEQIIWTDVTILPALLRLADIREDLAAFLIVKETARLSLFGPISCAAA